MLDTNEPLLQFFKDDSSFCVLAMSVVAELPRNPERTVCLRKLLEAKDAAERAARWK